nr:peroxidase 57-like [Lolium perenne]
MRGRWVLAPRRRRSAYHEDVNAQGGIVDRVPRRYGSKERRSRRRACRGDGGEDLEAAAWTARRGATARRGDAAATRMSGQPWERPRAAAWTARRGATARRGDAAVMTHKDAVRLAGGNAYAVRTGRRDRRQSKAVDVNLPGPESTVAQATAFFSKLGLGQMDMVLLLGAHTVGVTHCSAIKSSRLYSYGGKAGATDPSLDPYYAFVYKNYVCPNKPSTDNTVVFLDDQWSALKVDKSFYKMLQKRRGVLSVDQNLYGNGAPTRWMVDMLANTDNFSWLFPQALVKLSEVNVLTGTQGEIRRVCNKFN